MRRRFGDSGQEQRQRAGCHTPPARETNCESAACAPSEQHAPVGFILIQQIGRAASFRCAADEAHMTLELTPGPANPHQRKSQSNAGGDQHAEHQKSRKQHGHAARALGGANAAKKASASPKYSSRGRNLGRRLLDTKVPRIEPSEFSP